MIENKITKKLVLIFLGIMSLTLGCFLLLSLFHQEAPKNTIRILIHQPLNENHIRILPLIQEYHYTYVPHGEDFDLIPPSASSPTLQFKLVRDENTRALIFLKKEADLIYNGLSLAKTEWLRRKLQDSSLIIIEKPGNATSYLAVNKDSVRESQTVQAIESALPTQEWAKTVFLNWVEAIPTKIEPQTTSPVTLNYLTTGSREGLLLAQLVREALQKIGLTINIKTHESSLFYAKIRKKEFDLFSARSIAGSKSILDTPNLKLIPLFRWKNCLIMNSRIRALTLAPDSLDETFRFLKDLRLQ